MKNLKWGYLLFAVLLIGAGVAFLAFPDEALNGVRIAIGVAAVLFAAIYIVMVLAKKERGTTFWTNMVFGGLGAVTGGFMIFAPDAVHIYLIMVAGFYLILDGAFKLQTAILSKRYRSPAWWIMTVLAVAVIALGAYLFRARFDPEEEIRTASIWIGIGLLIDGLGNLFSVVYLWYIEKKNREAIVEELREEGKLVTVLSEEKADEAVEIPLAPAAEVPAVEEKPKRRFRRAKPAELPAPNDGEEPSNPGDTEV